MIRVRFCTLFSGSSANSSYIEINGRAILIDAGAGIKKLGTALKNIESDFDKIDAVFVTHEHSDHINGLSTILRRYSIPVIANQKTLNGIVCACPDINPLMFRCMPTGSKAVKGDFEVSSFASSHDSAESVGYIVNANGIKLGILTDTGAVSDEMKHAILGCRALILESNHDPEMLRNGGYPPGLKKRISGIRGHLSNIQCAETLCSIAGNIEHVFLAHLSKENNRPQLAYATVTSVLADNGIRATDMHIEVSEPSVNSTVLEF